MKKFPLKKIAFAMALAGLPGLVAAADISGSQAFPKNNGQPFVGASNVRITFAAGAAEAKVKGTVYYYDASGTEVGTGSLTSTDSDAGAPIQIDISTSPPAGATKSVIILDKNGGGDDFGGQPFGFIKANGTGVTGAATLAAAKTAASAGPGLLPLKSTYTKISLTDAKLDAASGTKLVYITFNADPQGFALNQINLQSGLTVIADEVNATVVGDPLNLKVLTAATGTRAAPVAFANVPDTVENAGGLTDGAGNAANAKATINPIAALTAPTFATTNTADIALAEGNAANLYGKTGTDTATFYIRMKDGIALPGASTVKQGAGTAASDIVDVLAGGASIANNIEANAPFVANDANGNPTLLGFNVGTGGDAAFRLDKTTGNLYFTTDNTASPIVWSAVTIKLLAPTTAGNQIALALNNTITLNTAALTGDAAAAKAVVAGVAESAVVKTHHFTQAGNLVDGAEVDFQEPVGNAAAADFKFLTVAVPGLSTSQAGSKITFSLTQPTAPSSIVDLAIPSPTQVDWTTGDTAADAAFYNATNFNSGIVGANVPFAVSLNTSPTTTYSLVYDKSTGLQKTVSLTNTAVGDGVPPAVVEAALKKVNASDTTGVLTIKFSEILTAWGDGNPFSLGGDTDAVLQKAVNDIAYGKTLPGTTVGLANFNANSTITGTVANYGTVGTIVLNNVSADFLGQPLLISPRISTQLDNVTLDYTKDANNLGAGISGADNNPLSANGEVTIGADLTPNIVKARAVMSADANLAGKVDQILVTLSQAVTKGTNKLDDYVKVDVYNMNPNSNATPGSTGPAGNDSFCAAQNAGTGSFAPDVSALLNDSQVSIDATGKLLTLTLPTALKRANYGVMCVDYAINGAKTFAAGKTPAAGPITLQGNPNKELEAVSVAVNLPDVALGLNRLYTMDVNGTFAGAQKDQLYSVYLGTIATPQTTTAANTNITGGTVSLSGDTVVNGLALGIDYSASSIDMLQAINQSQTSVTAWITLRRTNDTQPGSSTAGVNRIGASATLYASASAAGAGVARANQAGNTSPADNTVVSQGSSNGYSSGSSSSNTYSTTSTNGYYYNYPCNYYNYNYDQSTTCTQTNASNDASNSSSNNSTSGDYPSMVYQVSIDPKTGAFTGKGGLLTGTLTLKTNNQSVNGFNGSGFAIVAKDGTLIDPANANAIAANAATIDALVGVNGAYRFTISTDKNVTGAFLIASLKDPDTGNYKMFTSAEPGMSNYVPFNANVNQLTGKAASLAMNFDVAAITEVPLYDGGNLKQWQVLGVGSLDRKDSTTDIDPKNFLRLFITINTEDGTPHTAWQNDGAASDTAMTMLGNKVGLASQIQPYPYSTVAETSTVALVGTATNPKNAEPVGFALAFSDDKPSGGSLFFKTKAPVATDLPSGWSLVTIQNTVAPGALPTTIEAVISTGANTSNALTFFRGENGNTLTSIPQGAGVFVYSNGVTKGFTFGK